MKVANDYFCFNGYICGKRTVVEIKEKYKSKFGFVSKLYFDKYNDTTNQYVFCCLHDPLTTFFLTQEQINEYVMDISVLKSPFEQNENCKVDEAYIDGIVSAWILYISSMLFCIINKDVGTSITGCIFASVIFFAWRTAKKKGE